MSGFDYVESGLGLECEARDLGAGFGRLVVDFELSEISGTVEGVPIKRAVSWAGAANVRCGVVYLLGALTQTERGRDATGPGVATVWGRSESRRVVQIWARVYRVRGGVRRD